MAFQLTISEGKDAGKEFVFEQESVLIGRTTECDVVLLDAGVSRRHCRIFSEGGRYYVEDVGSANGTQLNGSTVAKKTALSDGDQVTTGPVVFDFVEVAGNAAGAGDEPPADANSTRIVSLDAVKRPPARPSRPAARSLPAGEPEEEEAALAPRGNTAPRPRPAARPGAMERPARPAARGGGAIERPAARGAGAGGGLSAAERARIKRESPGAAAQLKLFWADASTNVRRAVIGGGVALFLGLIGLTYWLVLGGGETRRSLGVEPTALSGSTIRDSFGLGDGVDWPREDQKTFEWEYTAATRAVVILHFQAQNISQGELVVTVNGVDVGQVPPDTLASGDRSLEMTIPPQHLKKGEPNRITFDNVKNPPGNDSWRIWNIYVEKALLPELPPDQLLAAARESYKRAKFNFDRPDVGARNRYDAWKFFREAWLLLEAHPDPKPDLYYESQDKMRVAQQELDRTCSKLLLEVEKYYNQRNYQAASATLEHVRKYFPEYDQPCAGKAEKKRQEYEL
ncbi:FHA domain-containing protein [Myxococcaceae bacterium GXIMD 01537]